MAKRDPRNSDDKIRDTGETNGFLRELREREREREAIVHLNKGADELLRVACPARMRSHSATGRKISNCARKRAVATLPIAKLNEKER